MKKSKFSYTTQNHLASLLVQRKRQLSFQEEKDVLLSDVEEELAAFCELKRKSIVDIKRGINQPSLPVAMMIAKFFAVSLENIFVLKTKEELMMEKVERMKELIKLLNGPVLDELNGLLEEYLGDIEKNYPEIASEKESDYHMLRQFYMNLPASGYLDDMSGRLDNLQFNVEKAETV